MERHWCRDIPVLDFDNATRYPLFNDARNIQVAVSCWLVSLHYWQPFAHRALNRSIAAWPRLCSPSVRVEASRTRRKLLGRLESKYLANVSVVMSSWHGLDGGTLSSFCLALVLLLNASVKVKSLSAIWEWRELLVCWALDCFHRICRRSCHVKYDHSSLIFWRSSASIACHISGPWLIVL